MKVLFYAPVKPGYFSKWEYYQVDYQALKSIASDVFVCHSLMDVFKEISRVDVVYCWWWNRSSPVVFVAKLLGKPVVTTGAIHMFDYSGAADFFKKSIFFRLSCRLALRMSNANLFISRDQMLQVTSHCSVSDPHIVYSSLSRAATQEAAQMAELSQEINRRTDNLRLVTICWHTREQYLRKGVLESLYALADMPATLPFTWTILGGDGDGHEYLQAKVDELNLTDRVNILVNCSHEEKNTILKSSDLCLQPSWCEGFGNAVLEAMSHGVPALVSRYTAQPEVVGSTGFVCSEITPEEILKEVKRFASLSEAQRSQMRSDVASRASQIFGFEARVRSMRDILRVTLN